MRVTVLIENTAPAAVSRYMDTALPRRARPGVSWGSSHTPGAASRGPSTKRSRWAYPASSPGTPMYRGSDRVRT